MSEEFPTNPLSGDRYFNIETEIFYEYIDGTWEELDNESDMFQSILDIQHEMQLKYYPNIEALSMAEKLLVSSRALIHEVIEVENELNWKHWKSDTPIVVEKVKNEIVDVYIFLMNLVNASEMTGEELLKRTADKIDINIERQKSGY